MEAGEPDLKAVIEPSDASSIAAVNNMPKYVPATEVESAKAQAQAAQTQATQAIEQFRAEYQGAEI